MGDENSEVSVFGPNGVGLHLTINPPKKRPATRSINGQMQLPTNLKVGEIYKRHGLRLSDKELRGLRASREKGVKAIDLLLGKTVGFRSLTPDQRINFAMKAADLLLEKSLQAQLSREVPTALDREEQSEEKLNAILQNMGGAGSKKGDAPSLLKSVPVGVSLTVHLPVNWL